MGGQRHAPADLLPGKRPGTHCTGGWVGHRTGRDGCEESRSTVAVLSGVQVTTIWNTLLPHLHDVTANYNHK